MFKWRVKEQTPPLFNLLFFDQPYTLLAHLQSTEYPHENYLRNFNMYKPSGSILEYKEFEGRNQFVLGQPSWKEDAEYILNWTNSH